MFPGPVSNGRNAAWDRRRQPRPFPEGCLRLWPRHGPFTRRPAAMFRVPAARRAFQHAGRYASAGKTSSHPPPSGGTRRSRTTIPSAVRHPPFPQGYTGRLPSLAGSTVDYGPARTQETASGEAGQGAFRAGRRARAVCTPIPSYNVALLARLSLGRLGRGPRVRRPRHVRGRTQTQRSCTGTSPAGLFLWPHGMAARP